MDIKGDFSGIAKEGEESTYYRKTQINLPYSIANFQSY
jgi:hypothetical protein